MENQFRRCAGHGQILRLERSELSKVRGRGHVYVPRENESQYLIKCESQN